MGLELSLPTFGEVQREPNFAAALKRAGKFFSESGLNNKYAVQALHGHFPVGADEAILESVEGRTLTTRVVSRKEIAGMTPTVVGFTSNGSPVDMQWGASQVAGSDSEVAQIGQFFVAENLTSVFAIVKLPLSIQVTATETLLEDTDTSNRTQVTRVVPRNTVPPCDEATWSFSGDGTPIAISCCKCVKCG